MRPRAPRGFEAPALIQNAAIVQKLQSFLGIRGRGNTPTVGDTAHPVIVIEDLSKESFLSGTSSDRLAHGGVSSATANFPGISLNNPAGSNLLIQCTQIRAGANGNTQLLIIGQPGASASPVANATAYRDQRLTGVPLGYIGLDNFAVFPTGAVVGALRVGLTIMSIVPVNIVLPPGTGIQLQGSVAAGIIDVSFDWLEHPRVQA